MWRDPVVKRYAAALFAVGEQHDCLKELEQDLQGVWALLDKQDKIRKALFSPVIPAVIKKDIIRRSFENKIQPWLLYFLLLLVDRRRETYLQGIAEAFTQIVETKSNIAYAEVETPVPRLPEEEKALSAKLEKMSLKTIKLKTSVNPALLGGIKLKMGDKYIDGSIEGGLARLKERLVA